jgi:hypothetical protein
MAATTTLLSLVTPTQGTLSGTWGDTVNYGISDYLDIAIAGTLSFSGDGAITLANTVGSASGNAITSTTAQYMVIRITGTQTVAKVITGPSYSKLYMVDHAGATSAVTFKAAGQTGVSVAVGEKCFVYYNGTDYVKVATSTAGTVTSASVVSANGFAGTVATATTTPAITVSTSITGVLKGNGTAISAATAGTDYVAPGTATTFTATQTFTGTSSAQAIVLNDAAEVATISATAATGTINYDITTQSVLYYTSNASANWTVNFRASSGTSLNTLMSTGQSMTVAFLVTQGATAYYNSAVQIDGTTSGVTTRWLGGAPAAGNASGIDSYRYLIIKTGSATFTVLASNTQFKA